MKKILLVLGTPLRNAGVPNVLMQIVRQLSGEYHFDVLVCGEEDEYYDKEFCSFGGQIYRCPAVDYRPGCATYLKKASLLYRFSRKLLAQSSYDAVHCCNGLESAAVLKAAVQKKVPVRISHAHGYYPNSGRNPLARWYKWICKSLIGRFATHKLACAKKAGDSLFPGTAYQNILNPIDLDMYDFPKEAHTGINLLQIGYFCKLKNQLFSLSVLQELVKRGADATLSFIGFELEEHYLEKMQASVKEMGLADRVQVLPPDFPKDKIFPTTDFLLLPSTSEGLPLVALEGQAARAFCLLSDSVTEEVDTGLACHLPLEEPAQWVDVILSEISKTASLDHEKLAKFDLKQFIDAIRLVYDGSGEE